MSTPTTLKSIGNSTGVIIPKEILDSLQLSKGDNVYLTATPHGISISPYDAEFLADMELAEEIMKEDRNVLHKLAQ